MGIDRVGDVPNPRGMRQAAALVVLSAFAACAPATGLVDAATDAATDAAAPTVVDAPAVLDAPTVLDAPGVLDAPTVVDAPTVLDAPLAVDMPAVLDAPALRDVPADVNLNPLGLSPGVAVTRALGPFVRPGAVDLRTAAADLDTRADLATQAYAIRLPSRFDPRDPARRYGLIAYIDAGDAHAVPGSYAPALDARDIIWVGGQGIGNAQPVARRMGVTLLGALRVMEAYNVDPARVYVSGLSGGGRTAGALGYLRTDVFRGFIGRVGAAIPARIPGWQTAGVSATDLDGDYEVMNTSGRPSMVLPVGFRTAIITQFGDFRRAELMAIYRYGHLNHGNAVRLVVRPGGHSDEIAPSFVDALGFVEDPGADIVRDRFEDGDLGANTDAGSAPAGTGWSVRRGAAREERVTVNGASLGVMRLVGAGAEVAARDTFSWRDPVGITLDARLRAETARGQNQRIALHIVPDGTAPAATQPGIHLTWADGQPSAVELIAADGARRPLATWSFAGPRPLELATTVTSPQSGEGTVPEKTFWNAATAPDVAGASLRFRGEDVRVVLSAVGLQLTFNRRASALTTSYTGRITLQTSADGEDLPVVLQGFWSEVEPALIAGLPSGAWRVVITNESAGGSTAVGDALVDEIRLVGRR